MAWQSPPAARAVSWHWHPASGAAVRCGVGRYSARSQIARAACLEVPRSRDLRIGFADAREYASPWAICPCHGRSSYTLRCRLGSTTGDGIVGNGMNINKGDLLTEQQLDDAVHELVRHAL